MQTRSLNSDSNRESLDRGASRRPLDRLTLTITLTSDLIFIGGRDIVMAWTIPCAKFGDFSLSRLGSIVRTDRQTDRITEADQRYTQATIPSESVIKRGLSSKLTR